MRRVERTGAARIVPKDQTRRRRTMGRRTHGGISVRVGTRGEVLSAADHRGPQLKVSLSVLSEKPDWPLR